jgi:hypothetical protein
MTLRRIAIGVLLSMLAGMVSATASAAHPADCESETAPSHAQGSPCPDTDSEGHPCGPTCPCACCPGHAPVVALACQKAALAPPTPTISALSELCDLHPEDVSARIFHPPRA